MADETITEDSTNASMILHRAIRRVASALGIDLELEPHRIHVVFYPDSTAPDAHWAAVVSYSECFRGHRDSHPDCEDCGTRANRLSTDFHIVDETLEDVVTESQRLGHEWYVHARAQILGELQRQGRIVPVSNKPTP